MYERCASMSSNSARAAAHPSMPEAENKQPILKVRAFQPRDVAQGLFTDLPPEPSRQSRHGVCVGEIARLL